MSLQGRQSRDFSGLWSVAWMPGSSPGLTNGNDDPLRASRRGRPTGAASGIRRRLARPRERLQLANDGAAAAVSGGLGGLPVLLWHPVELAGPAGRAPWGLCRAEDFRDQYQRPDLLESCI